MRLLFCLFVLVSTLPLEMRRLAANERDMESGARSSIKDVDTSLFFTLDGKTRFYTGRNVHAQSLAQVKHDFDLAAAAGEKIVRMHLLVGRHANRDPKHWRAFMETGAPNARFLEAWDEVFQAAAERGLHVNPIFDTHGQWQAVPGAAVDSFRRNIFTIEGGPATSRSSIVDSVETRAKYIEYFELLTRHFSKHENIFAWETYTELNVSFRTLAAPAQHRCLQQMAELMVSATETIKANDPFHRPVFTSLAQRSKNGVDVGEWERAIIGNPAICDVASVHSYPTFAYGGARLARNTIELAERNRRYSRLFYVGECDLALKGEVDKLLMSGTEIEYRKSLWSGMTHGISNGGMWWFHDRFARGTSPRQREFTSAMNVMCQPINEFVREIDFTGMKLLPLSGMEQAEGSAIGNRTTIIGYLWNRRCIYRKDGVSWPTDITVGESIELEGLDAVFCGKQARVSFFSPEDLTPLGSVELRFGEEGSGVIEIPPFNVDMAFTIRPVAE